jgi:glycosyltransferase involved in cell wall biosynthesis
MEYDWTPWLVARILGRPLVLEVHSPYFLERKLRGRNASRLSRWLERTHWTQAERIWVNSRELRSIVVENGIAPDHVRFIPFGVRLRPASRRVPVDTRSLQIVFAGSFYPWHGVAELLEAVSIARARVPGLRLRLIGDGITRVRNEQQARDLGLEDVVEFTGWQPHEKVEQQLADADVGVAPYLAVDRFYFEPVKVLDYMAAGLAVVASEQGGVAGILEHGKNGLLVPPGDVPALAEAFIKLARDISLRERLGVEAREKIAAGATWQLTAKRVRSLCEEAMISSPGTAA